MFSARKLHHSCLNGLDKKRTFPFYINFYVSGKLSIVIPLIPRKKIEISRFQNICPTESTDLIDPKYFIDKFLVSCSTENVTQK